MLTNHLFDEPIGSFVGTPRALAEVFGISAIKSKRGWFVMIIVVSVMLFTAAGQRKIGKMALDT